MKVTKEEEEEKKNWERKKSRGATSRSEEHDCTIRFFFWSSFVSVSFVDATATATARRRRRSRREGLLDDDDEVALNEGAATERIVVTGVKR